MNEKCPKCENAIFTIEHNIGATVIRCSNCKHPYISLHMGRIGLDLYCNHKIPDVLINTFEYCDKPKFKKQKG